MEQISTLSAFKRHARPILAGVVLGLTLIWAQNALANPLQPFENMSENLSKEANTCAQAIAQQERRHAIPRGLLQAISHAESGRWDAQNGAILAWPWTVTTGGKGYFLPNRVDAVAFVKALQADGVENIDVGCMQINLKYHPDAFASIDQAFNPFANAAYAANFLHERFTVSDSWLQAAGDYHSTTEDKNKAYREKVAKLWEDTKSAPRLSVAANTRSSTGTDANLGNDAANAALLNASYQLAATNTSMPDANLTKRFNETFRARVTQGGISNNGQTIANRVNALKPGANLTRAAGVSPQDSFAQKRQAQLAAWRNDNGYSR